MSYVDLHVVETVLKPTWTTHVTIHPPEAADPFLPTCSAQEPKRIRNWAFAAASRTLLNARSDHVAVLLKVLPMMYTVYLLPVEFWLR